ncbi:PAS domain S-box-containing protein [Streptomyces sp. Termitarium-T10T-6]|nr:PAS domain S-box-containing protein [Streptomyces sp. Termitarium-T10T-6]
MRLPDPAASRAVLIGASRFETLTDLLPVKASVEELAKLLSQQRVWGLPPENCHIVADPGTPRELSAPVAQAANEATDTLLVYYGGHGLLETRTGLLHLAVSDSLGHSVHDTAAPYDWIRRAVEQSPARRRVVIIDCCYSARAFGVQSAEADLQVEGTYLLAATAENAVALAPPTEGFTSFTGELIALIENGVQDGGEFLDLDTIYHGLQITLRLKGRPEPHRLCRDGLGGAPFLRNIAHTDRPSPSSLTNWTSVEDISEVSDDPTVTAELTNRLESLRHVTDLLAELSTARSLADTLRTAAEGIVAGLGYELACVNLVRPDGDLVVAAFAGNTEAEALLTGRVGSRASWDRRLTMGEAWDQLRFIPHTEGWVLLDDDVPQWHTEGPEPRFEDEWHPLDRLYAPMYASGGGRDLLGVISVDRPRNGRRPGPWRQQSLQLYASQAAIAISNARLRANMQRALVRLEREQQALRASEESFRQAFEYAPSGMAIAETGGDQHGRLLRTNDALCRLLGRPASVMRRYSFADLVHPEDIGTLLRTSAEGGRAKLRLARRDGTYLWVSMRNSMVADTADGPRFLLTHVEQLDDDEVPRLRRARATAQQHRALTQTKP